jgi:hypothetical protein
MKKLLENWKRFIKENNDLIRAIWKDRTKPDANGRFDNAPLTSEEEHTAGKANVWAMDWEMDGGTLPRNIQRISDTRRRLKPAEVRELNYWFYQTAPGDF